MTLEVSVKADLRKALKRVSPNQRRKVIRFASMSLNRAAQSSTTQVVRKLSTATGAKQKAIRKRISIVKANQFRLIAKLKAKDRPMNTIEFVVPSKQFVGAFRKQKGVTAKPWGKRRTYPGTFIGKGRNSGKLLVFIRSSKKASGIRGHHGPQIPREFIKDYSTKVLKEHGGYIWAKEFRRLLRML